MKFCEKVKDLKKNIFFFKCTRIVPIIAPPPSPKKFPCFHEEGGGNYWKFSWIFTFFDSRHFQMSSSELKLYFITYYRPLVYFEVFSIYLSVFHEFMWSPKKVKKNFLGFFGFMNFFFPCFREGGGELLRGGGNYGDNSGYPFFLYLLGRGDFSVLLKSLLKTFFTSRKIKGGGGVMWKDGHLKGTLLIYVG